MYLNIVILQKLHCLSLLFEKITLRLLFAVFVTIKMKTFLLFVALVCATTAIPTPTNVNGESLSSFLTNLKQGLENLKQGLENLLGLVQRFEMEQSTQIDQTTTESTMANDQSSK